MHSRVTYHYTNSLDAFPFTLKYYPQVDTFLIVDSLAVPLEPYVGDKAIVAYCDNKMIGFFRYYLRRLKKHKNTTEIFAEGTVVSSRFQRKGIASKLWKCAIRRHCPNAISVYTVSDSGFEFAHNLAAECKLEYPGISWSIF